MVVKRHSQVISDEILSRNSQIQRIPIFEFISKLLKLFFRDSTSFVWSIEEDIIPDFTSKVFVGNTKLAWLRSFKITYVKLSIIFKMQPNLESNGQ